MTLDLRKLELSSFLINQYNTYVINNTKTQLDVMVETIQLAIENVKNDPDVISQIENTPFPISAKFLIINEVLADLEAVYAGDGISNLTGSVKRSAILGHRNDHIK